MSKISKPKRFEYSPQSVAGERLDNTRILLASLSSLFPEGEAFFVRAVRHYRSQVQDEELQTDIGRFIGQEAFHSIAHSDLNSLLYGKGLYNPDWLAGPTLKTLSLYMPRLSLHVTAILEHWTATLAKDVLSGSYDMTVAERALWYEHAREEIEHAHVSWDVLVSTGSWITPLVSKLLFPLVSLVFICTTAFLYVQNGGTTDFKLFKKLVRNIPELVRYCLPSYKP